MCYTFFNGNTRNSPFVRDHSFPPEGTGKGDSIVFGSDTKSVTKLNNQMVKRGWSETTVRDTVSKPYTTRVSTNKATGNPATVYYNQSGGYVIIDDVTDVIVQVSDNINPSTWAPDPSIIDPNRPGGRNVDNINNKKNK